MFWLWSKVIEEQELETSLLLSYSQDLKNSLPDLGAFMVIDGRKPDKTSPAIWESNSYF
jgi:hypothetical protein